MTAATVWIALAILVVVVFIAMVVWWDRTPGPSTDNDTTPTQPPADPGAEGMRVTEPGDITTGPQDDPDTASRNQGSPD